MTELHLEGRTVGPGRPTFVIAEIGVNHDGSVQRALELVRIAAICGADAVKVQVFRAAALLHPSCEMAAYQKVKTRDRSPIDMLRKYELSLDEIRKVVALTRELRMVPIATPFSPCDLETVEALRLPAVKIASPDLVNRPLLSAAAKLARPLFVSTGAASLDEVERTARWLGEWKAKFALLHCVSAYPTPREELNLCWIGELASRFDGVPIGYSDHSTEPVAGALAAAAGAAVIEKHLTYSREAKGPDHSASADPQQFERYVRMVREADVLRGKPGKRVLDCEQDVRGVSRQSLVLRRDLKAGDVVHEHDLTVQRPGTGLSAALITSAVGRKAVRALAAGAMLQWDMLSDAA
jgi:N,N'-diacetyllegionaminate synthase